MKCLPPIIARLSMVIMIVIGFAIPSAQPVLAQLPQPPDLPNLYTGYKWSLEFEYERDLNGVATVEVALIDAYTGEILSILGVYHHIVQCRPNGDVTLRQGKAIFRPGSFITCSYNLHEYLQHAADIHDLIIAPTPTYPDFIMDVNQATFNMPDSSPPATITLFDHPYVKQMVTVDARQSTVALSTRFGQHAIASDPFDVQNLPTTEFDLSAHNGHCVTSNPDDDCKMIYSVTSTATGNKQILEGSPVPFEVTNSIITIGQSVKFSWSTDRIFIDPKAWKDSCCS